MSERPQGEQWVAVLGLAALYYAAARLGLLLAFEGSNASPVWPPSGLAVAALFLRGRGLLAGVALGAFSANAAVFAANSASLPTVLGASAAIMVGNCLEAWLGAYLLQRWVDKPNPFERLGDVAKFIAIAALASVASAAVGTATLLVGGIIPAAAAATVSLTWWIGDATGILVVAPLLIALSRREGGDWHWRPFALGLLLAVALVALGALVFAFPAGQALADRRFAWLFMPCIAWAAYRHGPLGVAAASLLTASMAVWGTTRGLGPFTRGNLNDALIVLQTFVGLTAVTGLVLAADRCERRQLGRQSAVRRDLAVPWTVLLASLGITVLGWHLVASDTERRAQERFHYVASEIQDRIVERIRANEQILRGAAGLLAASDEVTKEEWHAYVASLDLATHFPGIQAMGFVRMLSRQERDAHLLAIGTDGLPTQDRHPPGDSSGYSAIIYIEPLDERNRRALGYDMLTEPIRRAAMERARDSGQPAVSGKVILLQEDAHDVQAGILFYHPVFRNGARLDTLAQRRSELVGFAYIPLRMSNVMRHALGQMAEQEGVAVRLYSGRAALDADHQLYDSGGRAAAMRTPLIATHRIELPGGEWTLQVTSLAGFDASIDLQKAQIVLIAGVGLSLLLFALVRALTLTRERALMFAEDMNIAVRDSQAQFRSLAESASEAFVIADGDGLVCSWNRAAQAIFGYTEEEIRGQSLTTLMPPGYRESHRDGMARMKAGGLPGVVGRTVQLEGLRADGSVFPLELSLASWESAAGRFFSGIIRDITDRERAAQALRNSERLAREAEGQLQAVLRASPLGIIFTDLHGQLLYGNPTYLHITGLTLAQAQGEGWASAIHPDDLLRVSAQWRRAVGDGGEFRGEFRYLHGDGSVVWARAISAAIVEDGQTTGFVAVVEDISSRKAADAELAAKTGALERSNEELAQYAYVASHDLKEPLRTVASYSQLLLRRHSSQLDMEGQEFVALIADGAKRSQALVSDLLSLARVDGSGGPPQRVALHDVLDEVRRQLAVALQDASVKLVEDSLPWVMGDRAQLCQLLQNLIGNAIKFRRPGAEVVVHVSARPEAQGLWRISVADNGIGIDPRFHDQIFTIFKRLHRADFPGTGIGLAICKKVVERHGGRIGVESVPGQGSTFFFTIAAADPEVA
ncbi:CHASE domain-containing protein [Roseateles sp. P5_E7]